MRIITSTMLLLVSMCQLLRGQGFPFAKESPLTEGSDKGRIEIKMDETEIKRGEMAKLQYTFYATNSSYAVYNWQFNRLMPLPGQLAIYNPAKEYVGDLLCWEGGSQKSVSDSDWTFLYGGSFVGTQLGFKVGQVPCTGFRSNPLPAGTYYIQLIMYRAFLSPNPYRVLGEKYDFYRSFDRAELCRSNHIAITIVDK